MAREDILDYLWDHDVFIDDNTLSVHITRIRNKLKEEDTWQEDLLEASGTDEIVVMISDVFVRDIDAAEMKFVITSVTFPLEYIALIFVCVAVTILAVQQLSDSSKYKFRYEVLRKLGMKRKETDRLIFRQLGMYYLVPAAGGGSDQRSDRCICRQSVCTVYRGQRETGFFYFGASLLVALSVYLPIFSGYLYGI